VWSAWDRLSAQDGDWFSLSFFPPNGIRKSPPTWIAFVAGQNRPVHRRGKVGAERLTNSTLKTNGYGVAGMNERSESETGQVGGGVSIAPNTITWWARFRPPQSLLNALKTIGYIVALPAIFALLMAFSLLVEVAAIVLLIVVVVALPVRLWFWMRQHTAHGVLGAAESFRRWISTDASGEGIQMRSRKQVFLLWSGVVLAVAMAVFPPWEYGSSRYTPATSGAYHWFLSPPNDAPGAHVDETRLRIQWCVLAAAVATGVLMEARRLGVILVWTAPILLAFVGGMLLRWTSHSSGEFALALWFFLPSYCLGLGQDRHSEPGVFGWCALGILWGVLLAILLNFRRTLAYRCRGGV
jgi:hypothetical protein